MIEYIIDIAIRRTFIGNADEVEKKRDEWIKKLEKECGKKNVDVIGDMC